MPSDADIYQDNVEWESVDPAPFNETEDERKRREFKEKLEHWRKTGSPIAIPNTFRA